jgi:single-stranded DNA-binding protein
MGSGCVTYHRNGAMLAEFEIIGRVARITDLTAKRESNATHLVSVASTKSWQDEQSRAWQEKTFFHTLTVYSSLVVRGLEVGDLVRFIGDIESWRSQEEGSQEWRNGTTLVLKHRRILARKRQQGGEETGGPSPSNGSDYAARGEQPTAERSQSYARQAR